MTFPLPKEDFREIDLKSFYPEVRVVCIKHGFKIARQHGGAFALFRNHVRQENLVVKNLDINDLSKYLVCYDMSDYKDLPKKFFKKLTRSYHKK